MIPPLFIVSNPTGSFQLQKTGSNIPVSFNPNITVFESSQSYLLITGSDGHVHVTGSTLSTEAFSTVQSSVGFTLSSNNSNVNIINNTVSTSQSYAQVNIHTTNYGTFNYQFPNLMAGQQYDYIYCNTSSLKIRTSTELAAHYNNSQSLGNVWSINNQHNSWTKGIDFTCIGHIVGGSFVTLITPKHAIGINHAPPTIGQQPLFYDTGSNLITGSTITSVTNLTGSDLVLVTFDNALPSTCKPIWIFPTNWNDYILDVNNTLNEPIFPCIIPNTPAGTIECRSWSILSGSNYEIAVNGLVPNCKFTSNQLFVSGESSTPCTTLVNGNTTFMFEVHTSVCSGPFISNITVFNWVSQSIAPYTLNILDMSSYQNHF
jgi:hypothetical protein